MRLDEFVLRLPDDEFRIRFHEQLTVLSGVGSDERRALLDTLVGSMTGTADGATLTCVDHTGRPLELTSVGGRVKARYTDDAGGTAPSPVGWFAPDADALRRLVVITADDLGIGPDLGVRADDPPEVAAARAALAKAERARQEALTAVEEASDLRLRLDELDTTMLRAEASAALRDYATAVARLETVREEAKAVGAGAEATAADQAVLAEAEGLHRLARRWVEAADAVDELRQALRGADEPDPADVEWLADVPEDAPANLLALLQDAAEAERRVASLLAGLHELASASMAEPEDPRVLALATVDQEELWSAHAALLGARNELEQEQLRVGGLGDTSTTIAIAATDALEEAHQRWETAEETIRRRLVSVVATGAIVSLLALLFAGTMPLLSLALLVGVVVGVAKLLGTPVRERRDAARDEAAALVPLGAPTYLAFHLRRVDATLDPRTLDRVELAAARVEMATRAWAGIAGDLSTEDAAALRTEVSTYAALLRARHGTIEELAEIRQRLDQEAEPARREARQLVIDAIAPYGVGEDEIDGVAPEVVMAVVAARCDLGAAARAALRIREAEACETQAADLLGEVLVRLGYPEGELTDRFEAAGWAIEQAAAREEARANARPLTEIQADVQHWQAEVLRLERPEFSDISPTDLADLDLDVEALRAERAAVAGALQARELASIDVDGLTERRAELQRALADAEAEHVGELATDVAADRVRQALLGHLARAATVGPMEEPVPVLLDDPLAGVAAEHKWELMDMLRRLGEKTQVFYLTDDAFIGAWARRRAQIEESITLLEPVE